MCVYIKVIIFSIVISVGFSLYEDQIGKFDWKQNYIGQLKFSAIDTKSSSKKIFVATEENVLAALAVKSGEIIWRQILEKGSTGVIQLMHVDNEIITVTGVGPYLVRAWNPNFGYLHQERIIHVEPSKEVKWIANQNKIYQITFHRGQQPTAEVVTHSVRSDHSTVHSLMLPDLSDDSPIVFAGLNIVYIASSGELVSVSILGQVEALRMPIPGTVTSLDAVESSTDCPAVTVALQGHDNRHLVLVQQDGLKLMNVKIHVSHSSAVHSLTGDTHVLIQVGLLDSGLIIQGHNVETGDPLDDMSVKVSHTFPLSHATISSLFCVPRKDKSVACQLLLSTDDYAVVFAHSSGKIIWVREEALSQIINVELLDLPASDIEVAIEKEFDSKETGCVGMFVRRIASQLLQLQSLLLTVLGLREPTSNAEGRADLVRDQFGLHKMIVAITSVGKIFGIDNLSGEVIWQVLLNDVTPYVMSGKPHVPLFVQRTTRHFPYPAMCALLYKHTLTNKGVLYVFNPINGHQLDGSPVRLGYHVIQTSLLHTVNEDFIKGIILMDDKIQLHVYPESAKPTAYQVCQSTYMFTADPDIGLLTGYTLSFSTPEELIAVPVWEVKLNKQITAIVGKSPLEKVHSPGRVLGDRSVLYKYINPNLVAVITQVEDPIHKNILSIYLIDVVNGGIVFSVVHKRATEPVHIVHSENWVVYSYFNDKSRRTEVGTLELYEGAIQSNTTAFSSISSPIQPKVERQSYILPAGVEAMRETITEKGITSKHLLVALNSGGILEIPWMFLDPRRPLTASAELREEGVIPYMPELPIPAEAVINYNQTMLRVRGIHTVPSGLESTCLVFVYGLDLFYTRVAPSKTFDVLKEDFDHSLITAVLIGLTVAAYVTKRLASRKALKQAWK